MKTANLTILILAAAGLRAQVPPIFNPADVSYCVTSGNTYNVTTRDGHEYFGIQYNNVDKNGYGTITTFSPDMSSMSTTLVSPGFSVTTGLGD